MLAQLARTRARRKIGQLEEALEGAEFFTAEHAALGGHALTVAAGAAGRAGHVRGVLGGGLEAWPGQRGQQRRATRGRAHVHGLGPDAEFSCSVAWSRKASSGRARR
ncbi:MAG TPA: hypothetical protein VIV12_26410 [Streptosporangiaceae bacterium]